MPLPLALNTNEVKNSAGTEVEFVRCDSGTGRAIVFAQANEAPNAQHRLGVAHTEVGTGVNLVRRSRARVDKVVAGVSGNPRTISYYVVAVIPVGDLATLDEPRNVQAELLSFMASTGADTAIKFDGTGTGAKAVTEGTL